MLEKFKKHITTRFPFIKGKKIVVAISGGVDSVVLAHLFHKAAIAEISLAHCNFKLRGTESDLDEEFVTELAKKLNIPLYKTAFNTKEYCAKNKTSTQIAARELRYTWFQKIANTKNINYITTAHHANDNLETFLINLSRGTGLDGLTGIPEINSNIIRPLLPFSREEIGVYAVKNDITWREDASNKETKYLRNNLRHNVIPNLKKTNPNFIQAFNKTIGYLQDSQEIIAHTISSKKETIFKREGNIQKINIQQLLALPNPKVYLYELLKEYHFTQWDDVFSLLTAQSGKQITTKSHILLKDREFLLLLQNEKYCNSQNNLFFIEKGVKEITNPINLFFENVSSKSSFDKKSIYIDPTTLKYPLILKKWEHGDYFYPTGMNGKKKISKYFKDEKIPMFEKKNIWLLCNANKDIIWILGKRQDQRFLQKKETKKLLKISINTPNKAS